MSDGPRDNAVNEPGGNRSLWTAAALVVMLLLATLARIYGLGQHSTWWDDYNSVAYLGASDLPTYLAAVDEMNEMHVPLYFILQYAWGHSVGQSPLRVRLLSVCLGLLALPFVYLLGRDAFGKGAGLIAALCFALSPTHVFHGQAIRPYSLMVLLATISLYTLMRASRDNRWPWWVANVVTNILLAETHLFGVVLLFTEGCFLVLFLRGRVRHTVAWIAVHAFAFGLLTVWLHGALSVAGGWYNDMCPAPSLSQVLFDLAGDDAVGLNNELLFSVETWGFIPERFAGILHAAHGRFDYALLLAFGACLIWIGRRTCTLAAAMHRDPTNQAARQELEHSVLFLMVVVVPVVALAVVSHLWRPAIFPRYTMYSSIALYAIVGGAIAALSDSVLRRLAVAALVVLYAYQLSWTLPATTRTDWRGATDHIAARASPDDVVLVASDSGTAYSAMGLFYYNMGELPLAVLPADSFEIACDASACFLRCDQDRDEDAGREERKNVWVVFHRKYVGGPLDAFEEGLAARGLEFINTEFPAMRKLNVYRVTRAPEGALQVADGACALAYAASAQSLTYFAMEQAQRRDFHAATAALAMLSKMRRDYLPVFAPLLPACCPEAVAPVLGEVLDKVLGGRNGGEADWTTAAPEVALSARADYESAYAALKGAILFYGIALASLGDDEGLPLLRRAFEASPADALLYAHLADVIEREGDTTASLDALGLLLHGIELGDAGDQAGAVAKFQEAVALDPDYATPYVALALKMLHLGDTQGCMRQMRRAFAVDADLVGQWEPFLVALLETENHEAARVEAERLKDMNIFVPLEFLELLDVDSRRAESGQAQEDTTRR